MSAKGIGFAALLLSLLAAGDAAAGTLVCGVVRSGGIPVRGATLVALERGITAATDTAGSFCLDLDGSGVITVRAFAVGFEPGERVVNVGPDGATVRFELVPLRGASASLGGPSSGEPAPQERLAPVPPPTGAVTPSVQKGEEFLASLPVLVTAADSAWLTAKHKGSQWDTLFVLHDELRGRGHPADASDPKTWKKLGDRLNDLKLFWCVTDRPRKRSLGEAPCAYLQRGIALSEARSAVLAGKGLGRNSKVYLQGLAQGSDPQVSAWAKLVLARVSAGSPVGLAPPLAPPAEER